MSALVEQSNQLSSAWMALMFAIIWQSTFVAAVVAMLSWLLRRASPAVRCWLWQIVAIKLLVMPLWTATLAVPWPAVPRVSTPALVATASHQIRTTVAMSDANAAAPSTTGVHAAQRQPASEPRRRLSRPSWLMFGWIAIVLLQVLLLAVQRRRLSRVLDACVEAGAELSRTVRRLSEQLGLRRPPIVLLSQVECSPFVCGIWRPKLVMPQELLAVLPANEVAQTVAHELAHVKRRDLAWAWTAQLARMLFVFHPVAHLAARQIRLERELACDQWAMHSTGHSAGEYVETLVRIMSRISEPPRAQAVALSGGEPFSSRQSLDPHHARHNQPRRKLS